MNILVERDDKGYYSIYDKNDNFIFALVQDKIHSIWKFDLVQPGYEYLKDKTFSTYIMARDFLTVNFS